MIVRPNLVPGFTIVERLGTGGLSGVFRALRDVDGLEVALKVTSLADLDPEFRPAGDDSSGRPSSSRASRTPRCRGSTTGA